MCNVTKKCWKKSSKIVLSCQGAVHIAVFFWYVIIIPYCMHKFLSIDLSLLQGRSSEESGFIILLAYLNIMEKKLRI